MMNIYMLSRPKQLLFMLARSNWKLIRLSDKCGTKVIKSKAISNFCSCIYGKKQEKDSTKNE